MLVKVIPGRQLPDEIQQWWREAQASSPHIDNPYFCPEFTSLVSSFRDDVYVAVIEDQGAIVGVLPFQRTRWGAGRPAGGPVSDFQGIISRSDIAFDPEWLGRCCRVRFWDFPNVLASQKSFQRWQKQTADSPYIDLTGGFEAYCNQRRASGSHQVRDTQRQAKRITQKVGPLRLEYDVADKEVLKTLFDWKGQQYRASGKYDGLAQGWIPELLHRIHDTKTKHFGGMLSALYAGDNLVAAHFGMRSERVLHWWYPAYNRQFDTYSPGLILCLEIAREASMRGISRIDMGYGVEPYKRGFMNGALQVSQVAVDTTSVARALRGGWELARKLIKATPLAAPARLAMGPIRRWLSVG